MPEFQVSQFGAQPLRPAVVQPLVALGLPRQVPEPRLAHRGPQPGAASRPSDGAGCWDLAVDLPMRVALVRARVSPRPVRVLLQLLRVQHSQLGAMLQGQAWLVPGPPYWPRLRVPSRPCAVVGYADLGPARPDGAVLEQLRCLGPLRCVELPPRAVRQLLVAAQQPAQLVRARAWWWPALSFRLGQQCFLQPADATRPCDV